MTPLRKPQLRHPEPYRIEMDGDWTLQDLAAFPTAYGQLYAFVYAIDRSSIDPGAFDYPWRGGYSTVNFFAFTMARVPKAHRPALSAVRYASPGWMELTLILPVALSLRLIVKQFVSSASDLNHLYQDIYRGMHERRLMRFDARERALQLKRAELAWVEDVTEKMQRLLDVRNVSAVLAHIDNPIARLKLLLSVFRRVRSLAEYELDGKAKL